MAQFNDNEPPVGDNSFVGADQDLSADPLGINYGIPTMDDQLAETAASNDNYEYGEEYDNEGPNDGSHFAAAWLTSATDVAQGESNNDFDWEATFQEEPATKPAAEPTAEPATDIAQGELAQSVPQPELVEDAESESDFDFDAAFGPEFDWDTASQEEPATDTAQGELAQSVPQPERVEEAEEAEAPQYGDTDDLFDDLSDFDPQTDSNDIDTSTVYGENTQDQPVQHTLTLPPVAPPQPFVAPGGLTLPPGGTVMPQNGTGSNHTLTLPPVAPQQPFVAPGGLTLPPGGTVMPQHGTGSNHTLTLPPAAPQQSFVPPGGLTLPPGGTVMPQNGTGSDQEDFGPIQGPIDPELLNDWLSKSPGTLERDLEGLMAEYDARAAANNGQSITNSQPPVSTMPVVNSQPSVSTMPVVNSQPPVSTMPVGNSYTSVNNYDNTAGTNFPMADTGADFNMLGADFNMNADFNMDADFNMNADFNMANPSGNIDMTNNQFTVNDSSTLPSNTIPGSNTGGNYTVDPFLPGPNNMATAGNYATGSYPPNPNQYMGIASNGNYPVNDPPPNRFTPINPSNHVSRQPIPMPEPGGLNIYVPEPLPAQPPRRARRQSTAAPRPATAAPGDYEPFTVAPPSWGQNESSVRPLFQYKPNGEWKQNKGYTSQQLLQFILGPNKDGRAPSREQMTIWIQTPPNNSNNRAPSHPIKCCWEDCPVPSRTIQKGQFRVAFDEHPDTSGITTDPFYNTGYMHLYCLEQCVPLIRFINHPPPHVQVVPDDRVFNHPRENGVNIMALGTPHCRDALHVYDRWVEATTEKDQAARERGTNIRLAQNESLYYALTEHHLTKSQSRKRGANHIHLSDYMGDLARWQFLLNERKAGRVPPSRVKRPREDDDEEEEYAFPLPQRKTPARAAKRPRNYSEFSEEHFIHVTSPPPPTPPPAAPNRTRTGRGIFAQPAPSSDRKRSRVDDDDGDDYGRRENFKRVKVGPPAPPIDPHLSLFHIGSHPVNVRPQNNHPNPPAPSSRRKRSRVHDDDADEEDDDVIVTNRGRFKRVKSPPIDPHLFAIGSQRQPPRRVYNNASTPRRSNPRRQTSTHPNPASPANPLVAVPGNYPFIDPIPELELEEEEEW